MNFLCVILKRFRTLMTVILDSFKKKKFYILFSHQNSFFMQLTRQKSAWTFYVFGSNSDFRTLMTVILDSFKKKKNLYFIFTSEFIFHATDSTKVSLNFLCVWIKFWFDPDYRSAYVSHHYWTWNVQPVKLQFNSDLDFVQF